MPPPSVSGRGWPSDPIWVTPQARIDVATPGRAAASIAGVAWAPPHGVESVELRIDGGDWCPVDLGTELAPTAWRRWRTTLDLLAGEHTIQARAISRSGEVQDGTPRSPFPSGPTGYHAVTVEV
ncbi:hypothetical protein ACQPXH_25245 [Nocardia sp. CA-135953]|uniref:hypothetical protein n=1 Tax=Nocardia sp. CA-135953 TaxID=3239978 RepID=UPI003D97B3FF